MRDQASPVEEPLLARLYAQSQAARWGLTIEQFRMTIDTSVAHAFPRKTLTDDERERYLGSLHLDDLALATACAAGHDDAWNHFVREHRPGLYRAADAIDPSGGARDLADTLYADLFGLRERDGVRQSLFRYFHGRSRLTTWLRAVLSQRYVDRLRAARGHDPLPDDDAPAMSPLTTRQANPDQPRLVAAARLALQDAISALAARDRLRLGCYYSQDLTLAAIGRLLGEHEATVSRHLTRTRRAIREAVAAQLQRVNGFDPATIGECFSAIVADSGSVDLAKMIDPDDGRKNQVQDRSS